MSDLIDLPSIEHYKENNRIEAKRALGGLPKSIWETYSAFANTLGGVILLGVEEYRDKTLHAIDLPNPERLVEEFWALINNPRFISANILSARDVSIEQVDNKRIVVITVPRAPGYLKPVYVDGNPLTGSYVRNGEGDFRCSKSEVGSMLKRAVVHTPDMLVLDKFGLETLDNESVDLFREELRLWCPGHLFCTLGRDDFLYKIGALGRDSQGRIHPTAAGLLMFGRLDAILKEFPHYFLEYCEYRANSEELLFHSLSNDGTNAGNIFSWYKAVAGRIALNIKLPEKRDPALDYSLTPVHLALSEALVSTLVQADFYQEGGILITKYDDLMTFPKFGQDNQPGNGALWRMFNLLGLGPGVGHDLPRIFTEWRREGWEMPRMVEQQEPPRLSISTAIRPVSVNPFRAKTELFAGQVKELIIAKLTSDIAVEITDLVYILGISGRRARQILKEMEAEGTVTAYYGFLTKYYKLKT